MSEIYLNISHLLHEPTNYRNYNDFEFTVGRFPYASIERYGEETFLLLDSKKVGIDILPEDVIDTWERIIKRIE